MTNIVIMIRLSRNKEYSVEEHVTRLCNYFSRYARIMHVSNKSCSKCKNCHEKVSRVMKNNK